MAVPADAELQSLLDEFVCVRQVQMHGVDLRKFAFDGSLTWAIFMMNADGTIYGRYGSRSGLQKLSQREISLAGFKQTLAAALELHARYTKDRSGVGKELGGKTRGVAPPWSRPEEIPSLMDKPRLNKPFLGAPGRHGGCIHCHMVPANELRSLRDAGKPIADRLLVPYPMPNALGFRIDPKTMSTVLRVWPRSVAARAGIEAGDRIVRFAGQPIISTADIQWVLHSAGDEAEIDVEVARGDAAETKVLKLELAKGWRMRLGDWRFINQGLLRQTLGFNVKVMPERRARRFGLGGKLAMFVDRTTRGLRMKTGLGNRDLIVAIDGKRDRMTLGAFTAYVLRNKAPGSELAVTIMQIVDRFPRPEHTVKVPVK